MRGVQVADFSWWAVLGSNQWPLPCEGSRACNRPRSLPVRIYLPPTGCRSVDFRSDFSRAEDVYRSGAASLVALEIFASWLHVHPQCSHHPYLRQPLAACAGQMPIVSVDHGERCACEPRDVECREAGGDCLRDERVSAGIKASALGQIRTTLGRTFEPRRLGCSPYY